MVEYVRFSGHESLFGEKHLLHCQLSVLNIMKRIINYKKLREEELVLKIALKKRVVEILETLEMLDKILPHSRMAGLIRRENKVKEIDKKKEGALTLEQELELIRRKIENLRN